MSQTVNFLAFDLGSSNGRVMVGRWDGARFALDELHRFENGAVNVLGHIYWDALRLWTEIKTGLARYAARFDDPPAGVAVDTWGVDYGLLDRAGNLLGNPYHYRDARTDGMVERVFQIVPRVRVFEVTGIQFMQLNTLFQLFAAAQAHDPQLEMADRLLFLPDLFGYWLSGRKVAEYTIASTSQMLDARARDWAHEMLLELGIPTPMLPEIVQPGVVLDHLRPEVVADTGLRQAPPVIAVGGHDTASAVAATPGLDPHSVYISSGTWSLIGVETAEPVINAQTLALNFTNEGGVANTIRFLKNVTGFWLLQQVRQQWRKEGREYSWEDLLNQAERADPFISLVDPDDDLFLHPDSMPAAIWSYCENTGQRKPESVGEFVRCCLESMALKYRYVIESFETLIGRRIETIRIVGGGSRNRLLSQFTADACQRQVITGPVEATTLGNIMMQAIATGHLPDVAAGRAAIAESFPQETFEPRQGQADEWDAAYARFTKLLAG